MDGAIRLRRSTPSHDAYTVRVYDRRFAALATARPADARRWVATTRWLHGGLIHWGRLVVGLGVQWTPTGRPLHGAPPVPATLQLCVGHRCLLFHLAHADAVPEALRRFLADPRVTFVGSGAANDRRMLWAHCGLHVARGCELRAFAGMGNASLEDMADCFLGYPGIHKPRDVAMSSWHAPRLHPGQVLYACVDAYLAFRLGVILCPAAAQPPRQPVLVLPGAPPPAQYQHRAPVRVRQAPPAQRAPVPVRKAPPFQQRAPSVVRQAPPAQQRAPANARQVPPVQQRAPPAKRAPVVVRPAPRIGWSPRAFSGGSVPAVVGVDAASNAISKLLGGLIEVDMDSETDYDDDMRGTAAHGLPIRVYASDSDTDSSYGFEHVRFGAFTDDEEDDDDDGYVSYSGTGSLIADGVDINGDDLEDDEGCNGDDLEDDEGCNGDNLEDEEGCNGDDLEDEEGCDGDDLDDEEGYGGGDLVDEEGYCGGDLADEEGCNVDDLVDEEGCSGDDQEDVQVYNGDDLEDDEDEFEEFYLL
ncbi:hypothetical protein BAE44_0019259 [Dichanthelium oligosanthes]|uniref:3'-5' exonuclease domain-containing protein n=1 Tax=Dichanthelium oligosanthes TaxID=888268 RepID=A0A1E5V3U4_9POAL|nr:hypothetical protein BAE44_0019259 [Dichanthelium oligosanthes]